MPKQPHNEQAAPITYPLAMFEELACLGSVSSAEPRTYSWLLDHWSRVRPPAHLSNRLVARFESGSLLAVHWTGNPKSRRRTILIAHSDCEGYILTDIILNNDGNSGLLIGKNPTGKRIDAPRKNAAVQIVVGSGHNLTRFGGKVLATNENTLGEPEEGAVLIEVPYIFTTGEASTSPLDFTPIVDELKRPGGLVTATHVFKHRVGNDAMMFTDPVVIRNPPGDVFAPYVDNAAGVAVATTALTHLVQEGDEKRNVSILYTTGEEAGFAGILRYIAEAAQELVCPEEEVLWLVVDSSDSPPDPEPQKSSLLGLSAAEKIARSPTAIDSGQCDSPRCPTTCAAVRLGDKGVDYDLNVARMLIQSALDVRRNFAANLPRTCHGSKQLTSDDSGISSSPLQALSPIEQLQATEDWRWLGAAGVFGGGWCEAGILTHLPELVARLGFGSLARPSWVGSIAIPIQNYRQISTRPSSSPFESAPGVGDLTTAQDRVFLPERTHVSALNTAYLIILSACELHMTYYYPRSHPSRPVGYRGWLWTGEGDDPKPKDTDDLISTWHDRAVGPAKTYNEPLRNWVANQGRLLLRNSFT